jgi:hypothetical protein
MLETSLHNQLCVFHHFNILLEFVVFWWNLLCRGTDVSVENLQQGFTHIFALTFESTEGRDAYLAHPAHVEFAAKFLTVLDNVIIIDYKPSVVTIG